MSAELSPSQFHSERTEGILYELYKDCVDLIQKRRIASGKVRGRHDFETFSIIPNNDENPARQPLMSMILKDSANWTDPEEIERVLKEPIEVHLRLNEPDLRFPLPQVAVSIPHTGVNLFMVLSGEKGRRISGKSYEASESDALELRSIIDTVIQNPYEGVREE